MSYSPRCNIQSFDTDGTWDKPDGAKMVHIICIGGGGGGGSGRKGLSLTDRFGGLGGGPGYTTALTINAEALSSSETVTIGLGGTGAPAQTANSTDGNTGSDGGTTFFGGSLKTDALICARGGHGGTGGSFKSATGVFTPTIQYQFFMASMGASGNPSPDGGNSAYGAGAGGCGGAIDKTDIEYDGGKSGDGCGGLPYFRVSTLGEGVKGGVPKENGFDGNAGDISGAWVVFGQGGGGGGCETGATTGNGGLGGAIGGGGGGGGASIDGSADSGIGGDGGSGGCIVITTL